MMIHIIIVAFSSSRKYNKLRWRPFQFHFIRKLTCPNSHNLTNFHITCHTKPLTQKIAPKTPKSGRSGAVALEQAQLQYRLTLVQKLLSKPEKGQEKIPRYLTQVYLGIPGYTWV